VSLREAGGPGFFQGGAHYDATYTGGLLVAALLDVELHRAGRADGLDGFLRAFVNDPRWTVRNGPGWSDFLDHVETALGPDARERVARWTGEPRRFDARREFERAGLVLTRVEDRRSLRATFDGTRITAIDPRSEAARLGLATGDVLRSVNGREVTDAPSIEAAWSAPVEGRVAVRVERDGTPIDLEAAAEPAPARTVVDAAPWRPPGRSSAQDLHPRN
jgi:predicted metalloprotease with PDZ domain